MISDDFSGSVLGSAWTLFGPNGTAGSLGTSGAESYLTLTADAGNHDLWGVNRSARALQAIADTDFEVEARYLSAPTQQYQMQGILAEQDASNWIRFDTYSNGTALFAFAAVTVGGSTSSRFNVAIAGGSAPYLRVTRSGDVWTFSHSTDGASWTVAGSFTQAMTVGSVGPFAGSTTGTAYTAQVDYFFDTANIPPTEDGIGLSGTPVATDDALANRRGGRAAHRPGDAAGQRHRPERRPADDHRHRAGGERHADRQR